MSAVLAATQGLWDDICPQLDTHFAPDFITPSLDVELIGSYSPSPSPSDQESEYSSELILSPLEFIAEPFFTDFTFDDSIFSQYPVLETTLSDRKRPRRDSISSETDFPPAKRIKCSNENLIIGQEIDAVIALEQRKQALSSEPSITNETYNTALSVSPRSVFTDSSEASCSEIDSSSDAEIDETETTTLKVKSVSAKKGRTTRPRTSKRGKTVSTTVTAAYVSTSSPSVSKSSSTVVSTTSSSSSKLVSKDDVHYAISNLLPRDKLYGVVEILQSGQLIAETDSLELEFDIYELSDEVFKQVRDYVERCLINPSASLPCQKKSKRTRRRTTTKRKQTTTPVKPSTKTTQYVITEEVRRTIFQREEVLTLTFDGDEDEFIDVL